FPAAGVGLFPPSEALGGSLSREFGADTLDGHGRRPHAPGEDLVALLLLDHPVLPGGLDAARQGGVARGQEYPTLRHGLDLAAGGPDGARRRPGRVARDIHRALQTSLSDHAIRRFPADFIARR